jgi:seryl-tRNA synthetase
MLDREAEDLVYLSERLIRQWMDEYVSLNAQRARLIAQVDELQNKINELHPIIQNLNTKIRAAVPFSSKVGEWIEEQEANSPDNIALTDAILKTLLRVTNPTVALQRSTLQTSVAQFGYPAHKLQANPNYLYIALKRLIDRKLIMEEPAHHFRLTDTGRAEAQQKEHTKID